MTSGPDIRTAPFRAAYATAFQAYLIDPGEATLRVAYELGRGAVTRRLSVLDLAVAHHEALMSAFVESAHFKEMQHMVSAAGEFFLESLSAYEMVQRGYKEVSEAALVERRQTDLARRLSGFLADASLALDGSNSLEEMMQLAAEQARELAGASCCVATVALEGQARSVEATSYPADETHWKAFVRWLDLPSIYALIRSRGGSARLSGEDLASVSAFRSADRRRVPRGWLAASLTTLDGRELGAVQLFDKDEGNFTEDEEAALVHLAQMAAAAIERARLYQS